MGRNTVKARIFRTNAIIVLVTLFLLALVNVGVVKLYWDLVEHQWKQSVEQIITTWQAEEIVKNWTVRKQSFYWALAADAVVCAGILILVTLYFTRNLAEHICAPLEQLEAGARRMQEQDLSQRIEYQGDLEFEQVCGAFNEMEEALARAQEKNQSYEKARNDMISGISHDLKTPLTAIAGTVKALLDGVVAEPEKQRHFLEIAYARTQEMAQLLEQLLGLSRVETGRIPMDLKCLDVMEFLEQYQKRHQEKTDLFQEQLQVLGDGAGERIVADTTQLIRILDNLVENSRKYSGRSPVTVDIQIRKKQQDLILEINDHGQGIAPEKLPFVFDEFYRGDDSRSRRDGNGLGLYIVKRLMEQMGGRAEARNENGFLVSLIFPALERKKREKPEEISMEEMEVTGIGKKDLDCGR